MLPSPSFTTIQIIAINEFNNLRWQAVRNFFLTRMLRKDNSPRQFDDDRTIPVQTKHFAGIQNIRLEQIVGTLGREADFDRNFRPLKKHLRDRWVNAFLRLKTDGWQPILVHKLNNDYYVEDGHHRVSVAQFVGMMYIEAEVWDHTFNHPSSMVCKQERRAIYRTTEVCSVNS